MGFFFLHQGLLQHGRRSLWRFTWRRRRTRRQCGNPRSSPAWRRSQTFGQLKQQMCQDIVRRTWEAFNGMMDQHLSPIARGTNVQSVHKATCQLEIARLARERDQHQDEETTCAVDVENENQNCFTWRRSSTLFVVDNGRILALPGLKSSDSTYVFGFYSKIIILAL